MILSLTLAAALLMAGQASAVPQTGAPAGEVRGRVTDQTGLGVTGAAIFLTPAGTSAARMTFTGTSGTFVFANVTPGAYDIAAQMDGFISSRLNGVQVTSGGAIEVALQLVIRPYGETVVVTGSRQEELLRWVPAAVSVQGAADIQAKPVANYADVLRSTPGVNVIQFSARDVQLVARGAASQASNKTLALVDGRPAYQPYYGMIIWDLLGVDFDDIKQVEIMRGPGSALWGTNALTGVVNIITRDPAEDLGTHLRMGGGSLETADVALRHSGVRGRTGYKVSASFFTQKPWERSSALPDGTPLPSYENQGTNRFAGTARLDFKHSDRTTWRFDAGYATTGGGIVTPVGPQDARPMRQGFGRVQLEHGRTRVGASFDAHYARSASLLSDDVVTFEYQSGQVELEHRVVRRRFLATFAGIGRFSHFDINVTPNQHSRQELGAVADTEVLITDAVRLRAGARFDWFSSFGSTVSPRIGVVLEPVEGHTFRAAYNRAYVAPSFLENFLYFPTATVVSLPTGPFALPFVALGNTELNPLKNEAFEVGYTGVIDRRATVSVSAYRNKTRGEVMLLPTAFYSPASPPPGWPLPPELLAALPPLPSVLTQSNLGEVIDVGLETSIDVQWSPGVSTFVNHSIQADPNVGSDLPFQVNRPARHRLNAGVNASRGRFFGGVSLSYASRAFWADVQPFAGYTDSYSLVNGTAGVRFTMKRGDGSLALKVVNIGDSEIRQHIFGDVLRRRATLELRVSF
jgi:outer membrane receptor for ferrienterochelin and colicins